MNQMRLLALICVLLSLNGQAKSGANFSCYPIGSDWQSKCIFLLSNQKEAQEHFNSIDHRKVWLVYFTIEVTKDSNQHGNHDKPLVLAWTDNEDSPFLTFIKYFEIFSFSMLTEAVETIKLQVKPLGPNSSSDCLMQSSLLSSCNDSSIAEPILRTVTNEKGVVCFKESPSRSCCKYSHEDVECGFVPGDRWRLLNGSTILTFLFVIVGHNFLSLLVFLLPSLPAPRNGIEVISLLNPSPLSLSNILCKCFNNKPVRCFRDAFIIFYCRITVLLGLMPSAIYLSIITFFALNQDVFFDYLNYVFPFGRLILAVHFISYALYVVAVSLFPFWQYWKLFQTGGRETCFYYFYCWLFSFGLSADALKLRVKKITIDLSQFLWRFLPLCCRDKRFVRRPYEMSAWLYFLVSPIIFFLFLIVLLFVLVFGLPFLFFFFPATRGLKKFRFMLKIIQLLFFIKLYIAGTQTIIALVNSSILSDFATYTTIGFVISYKQYLPFLSGVVLVVIYVYQCYRSTNESFDELRRITFEVCTDVEKDQQEQTQNEPLLASQHQQRQLIYIDEENGSRLIPKQLFANICWKLNPVGVAFVVLAVKVCAAISFVVALLSVVLTLTPRSEFGNVAQVAITLLVGSLPKVFTMFSKNSSLEKQQKMETENRIRYYVKKYLENGALFEEEFLEAESNKIKKQGINLANRISEHVSYIERNRPADISEDYEQLI